MPPILAIIFIQFTVFMQQTSGNKAGIMTFTIDSQLAHPNVQIEEVRIFQGDKEVKQKLRQNLKETKKFTINWKKCPKKVKAAKDLKAIKIRINFAHGPTLGQKRRIWFNFANYSDGLMAKFFAGGQAKMIIKDDASGKAKSDLQYVKDANGKEVKQAGILTMFVNYENHKEAFFYELQFFNASKWALKCKPTIYECGRKFTAKNVPEPGTNEVTIYEEDNNKNHMAESDANTISYESSKKFSIDLAECGVHDVEDLRHLNFNIRFFLGYDPANVDADGKIQLHSVQHVFFFDSPSAEEQLNALYAGGVWKLDFRQNQEALLTPSTLTFTIDSQLEQANAQLGYVQILQKGKNCGKRISPSNIAESKQQFTVDWRECQLNNANDLNHIEIMVIFVEHGGAPTTRGHNQIVHFELKNYAAGLLRLLFDGGEALMLVSQDGKENALEYVKNPNGDAFIPPGILTFTVEYENGIDKLEGVEITHFPVDLKEYKPHVEGGKFRMDLAKCNVYDVADLLDLKLAIHIWPKTEEKWNCYTTHHATFNGLAEDELKKFYMGGEAKVVLHDYDIVVPTYVILVK